MTTEAASSGALPPPAGQAILAADAVHKRFGGVHALRGAHLDLRPAEIHALAGENGSGKSTLLGILSGQLRPDAGRIFLDGAEVDLPNPTVALHRGIVTVTQETTLVPELSVAENIFLGHRMARGRLGIDWRATNRRARAVLGRLELSLNPALPVSRLRPDQQQMVEIARALSMAARVLILDEPTSSLTDDEVDALFQTVRRLKESGVAVVFVSHRLNEVFAIADHVTVLRDGLTVRSSPAAELDKRGLISLMIGREHQDLVAPEEQLRAVEPVLRIRGLSLVGAVDDVALDVHPGEIVGLAGLVGAGRSEVLESIFGLHREAVGTIELAGRRVRFKNPRQAVANGVSFVPADRKQLGLVLSQSIRENVMMVISALWWRLRLHGAQRELPVVNAALQNLRIVAPSARAKVSTLSGGNQQKVVLAKWLALKPKLMMLDEPTRGVDIGAKTEIYRLLRQAASEGIGILVSSSETPELLILCDRILVLFRGRVVASLGREQATEGRIAHYATGHR
jgi:ABC-type sugar transport system ATPase subunit